MTEVDELKKETEVLEMRESDLKAANEALFMALSDIISGSYRTIAAETKKEIIEKGSYHAALWQILYDNYEKCHNLSIDAGYEVDDDMINNLRERILDIISETADVVEKHQRKSWEAGLPQEIAERIKNDIKRTKSWLVSLIRLVRKANR